MGVKDQTNLLLLGKNLLFTLLIYIICASPAPTRPFLHNLHRFLSPEQYGKEYLSLTFPVLGDAFFLLSFFGVGVFCALFSVKSLPPGKGCGGDAQAILFRTTPFRLSSTPNLFFFFLRRGFPQRRHPFTHDGSSPPPSPRLSGIGKCFLKPFSDGSSRRPYALSDHRFLRFPMRGMPIYLFPSGFANLFFSVVSPPQCDFFSCPFFASSRPAGPRLAFVFFLRPSFRREDSFLSVPIESTSELFSVPPFFGET